MYTLKIHWWRESEVEIPDSSDGKGNPLTRTELDDETTLFIPADSVHVHGSILSPAEEMSAWEEGSFFNCQALSAHGRFQARLIQVVRKDEPDIWYLASKAWLLGPDGNTIERIAP